MANKNAKNLLQSRDTYNRYYGDFRGVDFSSDHTQVNEQRLAYAVNMYKDYGSGQGKALETIPGFRNRMADPYGGKIYGIHHINYVSEDGNEEKAVLVHAGKRLIRWYAYPEDADVIENAEFTVPAKSGDVGGIPVYKIALPFYVDWVFNIYTRRGDDIAATAELTDNRELTITSSAVEEGEPIYVFFTRNVTSTHFEVYFGMAEAPSTSFIMNNLLYIIDGENFLVYDAKNMYCQNAIHNAYVPTTYINIVPGGENADAGTEYEQRNMLSPYFKHTFIGDGETFEFYMNEGELEEFTEIKINGEVLDMAEVERTDLAEGKIVFKRAPPAPEAEGSANVEITAKKTLTKIQGMTENADLTTLITRCTRAAIYDGRLFLTGNPDYPNHVFYSERNRTGYTDPTYFGLLNYMQDGVGNAQNTAILTVADTLMVLKEDTQQDGSVYFHTPLETGNGVQPKIYPSTRGLAGTGCTGAAANFLDDPVFVSRLGVEAIGQLSVRYERAIEHRSSLIDAKLATLDLSEAVLEEWNGYLCLLVDGKIFMADSRQRYTHETGVMQYEWYYLEDIGTYSGQYTEYRYADRLSEGLAGRTVRYCTKCGKGARECTCESEENFVNVPLMAAESVYDAELDETRDLRGSAANPPDAEGKASAEVYSEIIDFDDGGYSYPVGIYYTVHDVRDRVTLEHVRYEAYVCETRGAQTGGTYRKATMLKNIDGVLHFGTEDGHICAFNTDKRSEDGSIAPKWYTFAGRAIFSGCATKMDNCGIPHLTKSTVKKSTVIKTKSFAASAAKIKVRTNKKLYEQIARINSMRFSFEDLDFSDFSFVTTEQSLFAVKEKEKKWVEKQYFIYSDEYQRPFALYYVCYRYVVAGRYKE